MATDVAAATELSFLFEVVINGEPTAKIGEFIDRDGDLYAAAAELTALGIVVPPDLARDPSQPIRLADIPNLRYEVDQPGQRIAIELPISGLVLQRVETGYEPPPPLAEALPGMVFNYDLLATHSDGLNWVDGLADARFFGSFGVLSSGFLGGTEKETNPITRLDTTWTYSDPTACAAGGSVT